MSPSGTDGTGGEAVGGPVASVAVSGGDGGRRPLALLLALLALIGLTALATWVVLLLG